jgi:hypothetical protein
MSLSYNPLQTVSVLDPNIDLMDQQDRKYAILKGGNQYTYKEYIASTISNSSITFNCPPPSANTIVSRKMYVRLPIRLTFTGTSASGGKLLVPGKDAFRQFPISSSCNMLSLVINGQPANIPLSEIIHAMNRFNCGEEVLATEYSITPCYPDQSQDYNDLDGSIGNPLSNFVDSRQGDINGRGAIPFTVVSDNGTTAIVDAVITEPIFVSPAYYGMGDAAGFYNVNAITVTMNFITNGFRAWSHMADAGTATSRIINSIQMQFNNFSTAFSYGSVQPSMLFKYITPSNQMNLSPVNMPLTYPYFEVTDHTTDFNTPAAYDAIGNYPSSNLQLNSIPRKIYIYLKRSNVQLQSSSIYPDVFMPILQANVTIGNYTGQLTSATQQQLYEMALKNGYRGSFIQWSGSKVGSASSFVTPGGTSFIATEGSILCIDPALDLGLPDNVCSGYQDQVNFQVTLTAVNNFNHATLNRGMQAPLLTLHVVTVDEGSFVIPQINSAVKSLGIITAQDIINAKVSDGIKYRDVVQINGGGNFWSNLKEIASPVNKFLKDTKVISTALSAPNPYSMYTAPVASVAKSLGYGNGGAVYDPSQSQGNYGGASVSRRSLASRLRDI